MSQSTTTSSSDLKIFKINQQMGISHNQLRSLLPNVKTAVFFAKVYKLDFAKLTELLKILFDLPVLEALLEGDHSHDLQDYLVDAVPTDVFRQLQAEGFSPDPTPDTALLTELFESATIKVAQSIQEVAEKLTSVLSTMPSKQGNMVFETMAKLNRQRQTIGTYGAVIKHQQIQKNLVVLDVSGSMTEATISAIAADVVALGYEVNAGLAIVSSDTRYWEPGTYNVDEVLTQATYHGTHYETLIPLFQEDWDTVITIADYDSSEDAKRAFKNEATATIGRVIDLSLVGKATFLAEVLGTKALLVEPMLVSTGVMRYEHYEERW